MTFIIQKNQGNRKQETGNRKPICIRYIWLYFVKAVFCLTWPGYPVWNTNLPRVCPVPLRYRRRPHVCHWEDTAGVWKCKFPTTTFARTYITFQLQPLHSPVPLSNYHLSTHLYHFPTTTFARTCTTFQLQPLHSPLPLSNHWRGIGLGPGNIRP